MFWIYMALFNIPATNTEGSETCNLWQPTSWCQKLFLWIMGTYTLEDVTSPIFASLSHTQQIIICMKTEPALITEQYKIPFNLLSNPLMTGDMHNDVNRSLVWGIYKCNLASSKWFGFNSISWHWAKFLLICDVDIVQSVIIALTMHWSCWAIQNLV